MTDDPTWDAAASDRFNAAFDAGVAERDVLSTFRRLLAAHGEPVMLDLPPDLDPTLRDALIAEGRTNPDLVVLDRRNLAPRVAQIVGDSDRGSFRDALLRIEAALDHLPPREAPVPSITFDVSPKPADRIYPAPPTLPPDAAGRARIAKAEARRERVRARNLKNLEQR